MTETGIRMIMASIAVSTTMGVFMHDSQLDKAAVTALSSHERTNDSGATLKPELHVHGEEIKVAKRQGRTSTPDPRDQRKNRVKKSSNKLSKDGQAFFFQPV
ncbi:hypothetical protein GX865_04260 [Candidatus Saccharibacteria bacterium]|nr:hypothetical protein [Candidatus Saccharibacteria bacterium]